MRPVWPRRRPGAAPPNLLDDVAPTLDALARATAGGCTLAQALAALPDVRRRPFASLVQRAVAERGPVTTLARALRSTLDAQWATSTECRLALTVLVLIAEVGGSAPHALDRAAAAVRERRAALAERRAHAAQARLSATVLSVVPAGFAVWSALSDRRVAAFLLHSGTGGLCLAAGLTLNAIGWWWSARITTAQS